MLAGNGLDFVTVVKGVPELGDDEEVFALHEAVFESASDTLADFLFISVIYEIDASVISFEQRESTCIPQAPSKRR